MHTAQWLAGFALATAIATTGCCGSEQRAVTVSAPDSLTVTRNGSTRKVEIVTRLDETQGSASSFEFVYNTIEGSRSGEGIALTLSGVDPVSDEVVLLVLALPVSLRDGDEYPVGATFPVDAGVPSDPRFWGPHDLEQPGQAETAFTIASYTFPPGVYDATYRAATSTGTIRVTDRENGWVRMTLNLAFTDASGVVTTVSGPVQVNSEEYSAPCT